MAMQGFGYRPPQMQTNSPLSGLGKMARGGAGGMGNGMGMGSQMLRPAGADVSMPRSPLMSLAADRQMPSMQPMTSGPTQLSPQTGMDVGRPATLPSMQPMTSGPTPLSPQIGSDVSMPATLPSMQPMTSGPTPMSPASPGADVGMPMTSGPTTLPPGSDIAMQGQPKLPTGGVAQAQQPQNADAFMRQFQRGGRV